MKPEPSSTSSSEPTVALKPTAQARWRAFGWFMLGVVAVLVAFELLVAWKCSIPAGQQIPRGALQRYFSYGSSTESKLERLVGQSGEAAAIVRAGWLENELYPPPKDWDTTEHRVVFYGMSFTNRLAEELKRMQPNYGVMTRAGPAAPLSHSYALFEADPHRTSADVVVVGVLSVSIPYLQAMTGMGYMLENPPPFTYPRFTLTDDGELVRIDPVITDRDTFINAFRQRNELWRQQRDQFAEHDDYWNSFLFDASPLDHSALVGLLRRAIGKHWVAGRLNHVYDPHTGYKRDDPTLRAAPVLLSNMAKQCRADGQHLVVILLHAMSEPGHLGEWLAPPLREQGIDVISTAELFDSTDLLNFEGDGHYLPSRDHEITTALIELITAD